MNTAERLQCWREIFDKSPHGFFVAQCSAEGPLLHVNDALVKMLRFDSAEDYIRAGPAGVFPDAADRQRIFDAVARDGFVHFPRLEFRCRDGSPFWCDMLLHMLRDGYGSPELLVGIVEDIGDRMAVDQRLEESEERLRIIESGSPDRIFFQDTDLKYRWLIHPMAPHTAETVLGKTDGELLPPENAAYLTALKKRVMETRSDVRQQIWLDLPLGRACFDTIYTPSIDEASGAVLGVVGYARDITPLKDAEAELARSREEYRVLAENVPDVVYVMDERGIVTYVGPQIERYGFKPGEVIGQSYLAFVDPADREDVSREFDLTSIELRDKPLEFRARDRRGNLVWFEERGRAMRDAEGRPVKVIGILRDITERKALEAERRRLGDLYRALAEGSPDMIFVLDRHGRYLYANDRTAALHHMSAPEMLGKTQEDLFGPEVGKEHQRVIREVFTTGVPYRSPQPAYFADPGVWGDTFIVPVKDVEGKVVAVQGSSRDVTALKNAERKLQEALDRLASLETIIARSPAVAIRWRIATHWPVEYVSRNISQFGFEAEDVMAGRTSWMEITHREDDIRVEQELQDYMRRGIDEFAQEYRIVTRAGAVRWIEDRSLVIRDAGGSPSHIQSVLLDITERKAADAVLRENEMRFRQLYQNLPIPTLRMQRQGDDFMIIDCNRASVEWSDGGLAKLLGKRLGDSPFPRHMISGVRQAFDRKGVVEWEGWYDLVTTPSRRYVHMTFGYIPPDNVICHALDLTPQRLTEDALHESQARFKALFDGSSECISIFDRLGRYADINRAALEMTGGRRERIIGKNLREAWPDGGEQVELWARRVAEVLRVGGEHRFEDRTVLGGRTFFTETSVSPIRDASGRVVGAGTVLRDVSERRRLEDEIRRLADRLMETQEMERRELSGLLHDHLGQLLTLLRLEVESLSARSAEQKERVARITSRVDAALAFVRGTAISLRPPALDQLAADAALESLVADFRKDRDIEIRLECVAEVPCLDPEQKTCLYRVLQEALNNVVRHARARSVNVTLSAQDGHAVMEIRDDGKGFEAPAEGRIGLISMRERVHRLGGAFMIESAAGRGTVVRVTLPLRGGGHQ
jgi:PAS domain S-box-containing protein